MTGLWEEHRPFVIALAVWGVGALLFLFAVWLPFGAPVSELRADENTRAALQEAYSTTPPAGATYDAARRALTAERGKLDAALAQARARVEFKPGEAFRIPSDAPQREIEYTKVRDAAGALLVELANRAGVAVPADYDPRANDKRKELPSAEETDALLMHLAMADRAVRAAVDARVTRLSSIHHRIGAPRGAPLAEREMVVHLETGLDPLVGFIERCSSPPDDAKAGGGVLVVRSVQIKGSGGAALSVDVTLAAIEVGKVKTVVRDAPRNDAEPPPGKVIRSF